MDELRTLLDQLGLPPAAIPAALIAIAIVVYFIKRALDRRDHSARARAEVMRQYAGQQEEAMLQAYRLLYEQVNLAEIPGAEFERTIAAADDLIMAPFTRYRVHLDDETITRLYGLHNILAQYRPAPGLPHRLTQDARINLLAYRESFLHDIEKIGARLRRAAT